jgi:uncharacterized metal-binding protein YceD (DUF177 family)
LALEKLKIYQIDLKTLSPATTYKFDYFLDNAFFERVDGPEVRKGKLNVSLSVIRVSSVFELDFSINGVITVDCDRCLDEMEIPIETINRLVVTFGEMYAETSDERIIVSEEEGFINIAWYLYEFIALAIPIKHVHSLGGCNQIMASKLREFCVDDYNEQDETPDSAIGIQSADPRWDALRHFIEDN